METGTFYEEPPTECKKKLRRQDDFRRRKTHSAYVKIKNPDNSNEEKDVLLFIFLK